MTVFEKIKGFFDTARVKYKVIEHAPVYTSADAAKIRDTTMSMGAKALVFFADKVPILIVVSGDRKVNTKKFKKEFAIKDLRLATPEEVLSLTSLKVGSIPPVGKALDIKSYYDVAFKEKEEVAFNAGSHTTSITMQACDLITVEDPIFGNFV